MAVGVETPVVTLLLSCLFDGSLATYLVDRQVINSIIDYRHLFVLTHVSLLRCFQFAIQQMYGWKGGGCFFEKNLFVFYFCSFCRMYRELLRAQNELRV